MAEIIDQIVKNAFCAWSEAILLMYSKQGHKGNKSFVGPKKLLYIGDENVVSDKKTVFVSYVKKFLFPYQI